MAFRSERGLRPEQASDRSNRRTTVVELVGPAGAGKSALSGYLLQRDCTLRADLNIWELPHFGLLIYGMGTLPGFLEMYKRHRWFRWEEMKQIVRVNALFKVLAREAAHGYNALVVDEGPVFMLSRLHMLGHSSLKEPYFHLWWHDMFHRCARTLDIIVWLDAPDEILTDRIRARAQNHPVKERSDPYIHDFLACYRAAYKLVLSRLQDAGSPRIISFDTQEHPLDHIAGNILAALNSERNQCHRPS